jgi:hypothetical protein
VELLDTNVKLNKFKVTCQFQPVGGQHSNYHNLGKNEKGEDISSYSWRRDSTYCTVIDCFHVEEEKEQARAWQEVMEALHAKMFESPERRLLWGSFGDMNMDRVWDRYYETREKYDNLVRIKDAVDPHGVFSANSFCVGGGSERGKRGEVATVTATANPIATNAISTNIDARVMQNRKDSIYQAMRKKYPKFKRVEETEETEESAKKRDLKEEFGSPDPNDTKLKKQKV